MTPEDQGFAFGSAAPLARELSPELEKAVLHLVVAGFERWEAGGFTRYGDHEDHFTIRLVACMREIRSERNMALMPRFQSVEASAEMLEGREDPAHAPRIDIVVSWNAFADDALYSIECKRLALDDLARLYVVEGIARFVRGYYGAKDESGAMIGYVISGTADSALDRVNSYVVRAPTMGPSHTLTVADPIGWLNSVFASDHQRSLPFRPIRLTHLFFDMNGVVPQH